MSKTPAMILHELTAKSSSGPPIYTLVHQTQGTHENEFEYIVEAMGIKAKGRGRAKKEARQEAAKNALALLSPKEHISYAEPPSDDPNYAMDSPDDTELRQVINYIGELGDQCLQHKLPEPTLVLKLEVGPPHAREFTYECHMGSLKTQATASTKKQSRQNAAKLMLEKLEHIFPDLIREAENDLLKLDEGDNKAVENYTRLSILKNSIFTMKIIDYNAYLRSLLDENPVPNLEEYFKPPKDEEKLRNFLKHFDFKLISQEISDPDEDMLVATYVDDCPVPICAVSDGDNAREDSLAKLYSIIESLLE